MQNKKISRLLAPTAAVMGFAVAMGMISIPAYAADNKVDNVIVYNKADFDKEYLSGNNVIEQNGVKLTVTKIVGTKNRININAKLESKDPEVLNNMDHRKMELHIYMDGVEMKSGGSSWHNEDENTILIEAHEETVNGFPEKGNIRVDLVYGEHDINGSLKIPVDFTESFKKVMEEDINKKVENIDVNMDKFRSDAIGTGIITSEKTDEEMNMRSNYPSDKLAFTIAIDGKIYFTSFGDYINYEDDEDMNYRNFQIENLTYDEVKDAQSISAVPIVCTMSSDEMDEFYEKNSKDEDSLSKMDTIDNIRYNSSFTFTDGSKGDIKVQRDNNNVKIYCSSDSQEKSMLMAVSTGAVYMNGDEYCGSAENKTIYKDTDNGNVYVVEFEDVDSEKTLEISMDRTILNNDKFVIGEEVKVR